MPWMASGASDKEVHSVCCQNHIYDQAESTRVKKGFKNFNWSALQTWPEGLQGWGMRTITPHCPLQLLGKQTPGQQNPSFYYPLVAQREAWKTSEIMGKVAKSKNTWSSQSEFRCTGWLAVLCSLYHLPTHSPSNLLIHLIDSIHYLTLHHQIIYSLTYKRTYQHTFSQPPRYSLTDAPTTPLAHLPNHHHIYSVTHP
jgi:hypothetical protein